MRPKKGSRGTQGAYGKNHPPTTRALVDYDYLHLLSPDEKRWLARFSNDWYGGRSEGLIEDRREIHRDHKARKQDAFARAEAVGSLSFAIEELPEPIDDRMADKLPEYLDSVEYKKARENYRRLLPLTTRNRRQKGKSPKYVKALRCLQLAKVQGVGND